MKHNNVTRRKFIGAGTGAVAAAAIGCSGDGPANKESQEESESGAKTHEFDFTASKFQGAPDGRERTITGINGQFPGPLIRVPEGDTIRVSLKNDLEEPTTNHWHGQYQEGSWWMDGVDSVTQQPIPPGDSMIYEFTANPGGTFWYHSHSNIQYANGFKGPLIVEEKDPIAKYDRDETLMISDWFVEESAEILKNIKSGAYKDSSKKTMKSMGKMKKSTMKMDVGDVPFQTGLFNGKGRVNMDEGKEPLETIVVEEGEHIRLRLLNTGSTYSFYIRIDDHPMTVIAADCMPVKPVEVDSLQLNIGQRYDVLIKADNPGVHWIRAKTRNNHEFAAVLKYKGSQANEPKASKGDWGPRKLSAAALRSKEPVDLTDVDYREVPIVMGGSMMPYRYNVNGQYFPDVDPIPIKKGEHIRFLLKNPTGMLHPFHMHGQTFHVLGNPGNLNLINPIARDTVAVGAGETVIIQHQFNNPGRWIFHCHIDWHLASGMACILEVSPLNDPRGEDYLNKLAGRKNFSKG